MFGAEWTFNFLNNNLNRKIIKDEFNFLIDKDFILDPFSSTNGIIPRIIFELFDIINKEKKNEKIKISCSYIQVYNERIYDLLVDNYGLNNIKEKKDFVISI